MCGIFGIFEESNKKQELFYDLGCLSESRGKEASGFVVIDDENLFIKKYPTKFRNNNVKSFLNNLKTVNDIKLFGHTRLETSGNNKNPFNNQPIETNEIIILHNGIITNYNQINKKFGFNKNTELDSFVINELLQYYLSNYNVLDAFKKTLNEIEGELSVFIYFKKVKKYIIYTNTGSIFFTRTNSRINIFSSEEWITREISKQKNVHQLKAFEGLILDDSGSIESSFIDKPRGLDRQESLKEIRQNLIGFEYAQPILNRCSRCVLPETFPFIEFDEKGICNICNNYKKYELEDVNKLKNDIKKYDNLVIGFSGGRDSSYGIHLIRQEYSKNIVAASYDWGMVTDLARRNQAKVCGKLGIEHIWISADIQTKRENIKKNLIAWLHKPHIGMLPILMAGDKVWQNKLRETAKLKNNSAILQFQSPFEATFFKHGFAGIKPDFPKMRTLSKIKLFLFYFYCLITNYKYWNKSLLDSLRGFFSFYFRKKAFLYPFKYYKFDEDVIETELSNNYNWEFDDTTGTSWRIGDGTAPFYNYIYWLHAGFTENDSFRSYQVREGIITRNEALDLLKSENIPRFKRLKEYLETIDLDYDYVMSQLEKVKENSLVKNWTTL